MLMNGIGQLESMHESLVRINTDYLVQIADILNQMQQASSASEETTQQLDVPTERQQDESQV